MQPLQFLAEVGPVNQGGMQLLCIIFLWTPNCFISLGLVQGGGRISLAQYVKSQVRWSPPFHRAGEYFPTRCRALASIGAAELQPNPGKVWAERFPKGAKLSESRRQPAGFGQLRTSLCRCHGSLASPGQAIWDRKVTSGRLQAGSGDVTGSSDVWLLPSLLTHAPTRSRRCPQPRFSAERSAAGAALPWQPAGSVPGLHPAGGSGSPRSLVPLGREGTNHLLSPSLKRGIALIYPKPFS